MDFSYTYSSLEEVESYWDRAVSEVPVDADPVETVERIIHPYEDCNRHGARGV